MRFNGLSSTTRTDRPARTLASSLRRRSSIDGRTERNGRGLPAAAAADVDDEGWRAASPLPAPASLLGRKCLLVNCSGAKVSSSSVCCW